MSEPWAIPGLDLHLELPRQHLKAGITAQLREAVRHGRLPAGTRLPPSRTLAADLGIARNTIADAYAQLVAEGWLTGRTGSGTRVADHPAAPSAARRLTDHPPQLRLDLRSGSPDLSAFPRTAWNIALRAATATITPEQLGYGDPAGLHRLRTVLAAHIARSRGVDTSPDRIVITSGFSDALRTISRLLAETGAHRFAVEQQSLPAHRSIATAAGLRLSTIPIDHRGADLQNVTADTALLTPAHQFPTGVVLAPERRRAAATAARDGLLVIEDDYDGEFRYERDPVGALQPLAPDDIVYAGTVSKTLAPALRIGWIALPERLLDAVIGARRHQQLPPAIDQLALASLLDSGAYDAHVRRMRAAYRRRRDTLISALTDQVPHARITGIAAGLHLYVQLPDKADVDALIVTCRTRGLALESAAPYSHSDGPRPPALVLGYATPPEHRFNEAIALLIGALQAL